MRNPFCSSAPFVYSPIASASHPFTPPFTTFEIEVEVDMNYRTIAFGVPGGPLVQAPGAKLSSVVRPWAYLWDARDSVMLDARVVHGARLLPQLETSTHAPALET